MRNYIFYFMKERFHTRSLFCYIFILIRKKLIEN
nr:MAG TPA: hypothetical protein [Caudoviricetes sp.]DAW98165.1 MAG TPA: hypothetical protein [Bacteriophage sp.]